MEVKGKPAHPLSNAPTTQRLGLSRSAVCAAMVGSPALRVQRYIGGFPAASFAAATAATAAAADPVLSVSS